MKPSASKIIQRLEAIEARLKPQPIVLCAWARPGTIELSEAKEQAYAAYAKANPQDRGRHVEWITVSWLLPEDPPSWPPPPARAA